MQLKTTLILALSILGLSFLAQPSAQEHVSRTDGTAFNIPDCNEATEKLHFNPTLKDWDCQTDQQGGGGSFPSGSIVLIVSGSCPAGFVEETSLEGKMLLGTLAGNSDIGTTGGSDSITPAGTVSQPTFSGNALAAHSHTFSGNPLAPHSHALTEATTSKWWDTQAADSYPTVDATSAGTPSGTVSSDSGGTPSGTVSQPTFTGDQFDNRSAFVRVIFCRKT